MSWVSCFHYLLAVQQVNRGWRGFSSCFFQKLLDYGQESYMHQLKAYSTWESTGASPALPEKCREHQGACGEGWRVDGEGKGSLQMFCDYSEVSC